MSDEINQDRRRFLGVAAMSIAASELGLLVPANTQAGKTSQPGTNTSFDALRQIDAGLLNIGYAEAGPSSC
ncbi:MAG: hypothetical protein ABI999_05880 [Acidobacteriota bacterium]